MVGLNSLEHLINMHIDHYGPNSKLGWMSYLALSLAAVPRSRTTAGHPPCAMVVGAALLVSLGPA